jgi:DNA-binding NtrC family response regulator
MNKQILLVESNEDIVDIVSTNLAHDFAIFSVATIEAARQFIKAEGKPDLVVVGDESECGDLLAAAAEISEIVQPAAVIFFAECREYSLVNGNKFLEKIIFERKSNFGSLFATVRKLLDGTNSQPAVSE